MRRTKLRSDCRKPLSTSDAATQKSRHTKCPRNANSNTPPTPPTQMRKLSVSPGELISFLFMGVRRQPQLRCNCLKRVAGTYCGLDFVFLRDLCGFFFASFAAKSS